MNKSVWMLSGACALTVLLTGCSPELDQTQLSPEEQAWAENFKANYSAWQPPESVPRAVRRDDLSGYQTPAAETKVDSSAIPPAVEQPSALPVIETQTPAPVSVAPAIPEVPAAQPNAPEVVMPVAPEAIAEPAAKAPVEAEVYTVVKGDNLGSIAQKYYGRASAWKKIQKANMSVLRGKNKDMIRTGMKLTIPRP